MPHILAGCQVELDAIPHVLLVVRRADEQGERAPLPQELASAVEIPEAQVGHREAALLNPFAQCNCSPEPRARCASAAAAGIGLQPPQPFSPQPSERDSMMHILLSAPRFAITGGDSPFGKGRRVAGAGGRAPAALPPAPARPAARGRPRAAVRLAEHPSHAPSSLLVFCLGTRLPRLDVSHTSLCWRAGPGGGVGRPAAMSATSLSRLRARGAATAVAAAGFQRVAYLAGGIAAFSQAARSQVPRLTSGPGSAALPCKETCVPNFAAGNACKVAAGIPCPAATSGGQCRENQS